MISRREEEYQNHLAFKLSDPMTNARTNWSLLKTFYNEKKVPIIPPFPTDKVDFEAKANHFNNSFVSQCTRLNNNSKIPGNQTYTTNTKLSLIKFQNKNIITIIRSLNEDKAHGHDNISIRMVKICAISIVEPLSIIFNNCINQSMFPNIWKKSNICPIHKKGDKQIINNYRPVSLFPFCGKIFERIVFNSL